MKLNYILIQKVHINKLDISAFKLNYFISYAFTIELQGTISESNWLHCSIYIKNIRRLDWCADGALAVQRSMDNVFRVVVFIVRAREWENAREKERERKRSREGIRKALKKQLHFFTSFFNTTVCFSNFNFRLTNLRKLFVTFNHDLLYQRWPVIRHYFIYLKCIILCSHRNIN